MKLVGRAGMLLCHSRCHAVVLMLMLYVSLICCAQALHARALALRHPLTSQPMRFVAPLHADFEAALQALGLSLPEGV